MNDGGFVCVEVHQARCNIVHDLQDFGVRRCWNITNIVEEVTIFTEFGDHHHWTGLRILRYADSKEADNVGMIKVT